MKAIVRNLGFSLLTGLVVSCATSQSRFTPLGQAYPPKPENYEVQIFRGTEPDRPFIRIARLDVHLEKTSFMSSSFQDALPALKKQARLAGADAVIDIHEKTSDVYETMSYHVTATGIKFTDTK